MGILKSKELTSEDVAKVADLQQQKSAVAKLKADAQTEFATAQAKYNTTMNKCAQADGILEEQMRELRTITLE